MFQSQESARKGKDVSGGGVSHNDWGLGTLVGLLSMTEIIRGRESSYYVLGEGNDICIYTLLVILCPVYGYIYMHI
jgi:hypothetical protein